MKHSDFITRLNFGVIVRAGKVSDDPNAPDDNLQKRERLLNAYTVIGDANGVRIGIKPVTMIDKDHLNVLWSISALRSGSDGRLFSVPVEHLTTSELANTSEAKIRLLLMERDDEDIDAVFDELGMKRYQITEDEDAE